MGVNCLEYSTLKVSSSSQVLSTTCSPAMPPGTHGAMIVCEDEQWRYRLDGTAPTATEGRLVEAGEEIKFDSWTAPGNNWKSVLKAMRVIRVVNDGALKVHWFD